MQTRQGKKRATRQEAQDTEQQDKEKDESQMREPKRTKRTPPSASSSSAAAASAGGGEEKEKQVEVLEHGSIYFFYRPKVQVEEVNSIDDVQRLCILLDPQKAGKKRLLTIPKKHLPAVKREQHFAFVSLVSDDMAAIHEDLDRITYSTQTRGEREIGPARACGEGTYAIVKHGVKRDSHLVYMLEAPKEPGEVQNVFNIQAEASFVVQVKNPKVGGDTGSSDVRRGLPESQAAEFPPELQQKFAGKRKPQVKFAALEPAFLDYRNCELILVFASANLKEELGDKVLNELRRSDRTHHEESRSSCGSHQVESGEHTMKDLGMEDSTEHPLKPLTAGEFA